MKPSRISYTTKTKKDISYIRIIHSISQWWSTFGRSHIRNFSYLWLSQFLNPDKSFHQQGAPPSMWRFLVFWCTSSFCFTFLCLPNIVWHFKIIDKVWPRINWNWDIISNIQHWCRSDFTSLRAVQQIENYETKQITWSRTATFLFEYQRKASLVVLENLFNWIQFYISREPSKSNVY
jgi:hypothetical protein